MNKAVHHTNSSLCWLCSVWQTPCSAEVQTLFGQVFYSHPRQKQRDLHAGHLFSLFYRKGNECREAHYCQTRRTYSVCCSWLQNAKSKSSLPSKHTVKTNGCVKCSKTKLILYFYQHFGKCWIKIGYFYPVFLYQQLYSCVSTWHTPISFAKQQVTVLLLKAANPLCTIHASLVLLFGWIYADRCLIIPMSSPQITASISPQNAVYETHLL